MWRWLAYSGSPVLLGRLLYTPVHSLIDQSLHSRLGVETTNGDGFGVGWYGEGDTPGLFKSVEPAVGRAVGFIEDVGQKRGIEHPIQMSVATTNGTTQWVFRYSTERKSPSLYYSTKLSELRELYPELEAIQDFGEESRLVLSEPLRDLPGAWNELPESSCGIVQPGEDELRPFTPIRNGR